ncbi:MAG: cob(I)yrinic acid a,c-diamide adenosyltransferase [Actinomycetota bacterium]
MKVYTKAGDDGTTGLFYGGRVAKDSPHPVAYGAIDEAQAAIGLVRPVNDDPELDEILILLCRHLYVAMAELATLPANREKLVAGTSLVTADMVVALEELIDDISERFEPPTEFVIPGGSAVAAGLDFARTVARRAERDVVSLGLDQSEVLRYLNRLSDLLWTLARWQEPEALESKSSAAS